MESTITRNKPKSIWEYYRKEILANLIREPLLEQFTLVKDFRVLVLDLTGTAPRFPQYFNRPYISLFIIKEYNEEITRMAPAYDIIYTITFEDQIFELGMDSIRVVIKKQSIKDGNIEFENSQVFVSID